MPKSSSVTRAKTKPLGQTICRHETSGVRQNSSRTNATIATFHGHTTVFQLCPQGPSESPMKQVHCHGEDDRNHAQRPNQQTHTDRGFQQSGGDTRAESRDEPVREPGEHRFE